jgi:hypothetical protein
MVSWKDRLRHGERLLTVALREILTGGGAGLSATTAQDGRYRLYGVAGDTAIRVIEDGYEPRLETITVTEHQTRNFELRFSSVVTQKKVK